VCVGVLLNPNDSAGAVEPTPPKVRRLRQLDDNPCELTYRRNGWRESSGIQRHEHTATAHVEGLAGEGGLRLTE